VLSAQATEKRKIIRRTLNANQTPDEITSNPVLNAKIKASLPANYNFEVHKIVWRLKQSNAKRVGLQFPEGLFIFAIPLADILEEFAKVEVVIMGDVTYGACCVDDYTATSLGCDFLVHFAHSCLVPVNQMINGIKVLYIFVDIKFDMWHLIETIKSNISCEAKIAVAATIQFVSSIHGAAKELEKVGYNVQIPQSRPLSKGEVLGCTAPKLSQDIDTVIFVADGRFHLEAMMIANPTINFFYRYNPYDKTITHEYYAFDEMITMREKAINDTKAAVKRGCVFGLILGALGRQGSPAVFNRIKEKLISRAPNCTYINVIMPEITPAHLNAFEDSIDIWVQVACPRLSIDWGDGFVKKPLLTPYEFNIALNYVGNLESNSIKLHTSDGKSSYPMDFYANNSLGDWTPSHKCSDKCSCDADKAIN